MRQSLYERLKSREISVINELKIISNLLDDSESTAYSYFYDAFKNSPFKVFYEDFDMALVDLLEINKKAYLHPSSGFSYTLDSITDIQANLTLDSFLDYLEFFKTLSDYKSYNCDTNVKQIVCLIDKDCERLGYKFVKDEENSIYRTMLRDPEAESVALEVNESTQTKIYRYLTIRESRVDEKRECIKSLADDIEIMCKKYSNVPEYNKLKQFIQCVRHTKDAPKKEFPFYYKDEEKWLDKIFKMIIGVLSFTKTKEIVFEINKYEKME